MSDLESAIARGAILADRSKQASNNTYLPPEYYEDVEFACRNCGKVEVWTASQQKWYYEVAEGSIYARAIYCHDCRQKSPEEKLLMRQRWLERSD